MLGADLPFGVKDESAADDSELQGKNRRRSDTSVFLEEMEKELSLMERILLITGAIYRWAMPGAVKITKTHDEVKLDRMSDLLKAYRVIPEEDEPEEEDQFPCDMKSVDIIMSVVIVLNTIVIGLETDLARNGRTWYFIVLEFIFVMLFAGEIRYKVKYHGYWWMVWSLSNVIVTIIAILGLVDFFVFNTLSLFGVPVNTDTLRAMSLLRVVGLIRLIRVIRETPALEELQLVLQGIVDCIPTIFWIIMLVLAFLYINAVICTKAIGQNVRTYEVYLKVSGGWNADSFFGSIGTSMLSLLQIMTLDGWSSQIARHVVENQWYMALFFLPFIFLSTNGLLNVVVSVIVSNTLEAARTNAKRIEVRKERQRSQELDAMKLIFLQSDEDGSGSLDLEEYLAASTTAEMQWRLKQVGLDRMDVVRLFSSMDGNGTRPLNVNEFVKGCTKLKGDAMSKDLLAIHAQADKLARNMESLSNSLKASETLMAELDEISNRVSNRYKPAMRGTNERRTHLLGATHPVTPMRMKKHPEDPTFYCEFGNKAELPLFPSNFM